VTRPVRLGLRALPMLAALVPLAVVAGCRSASSGGSAPAAGGAAVPSPPADAAPTPPPSTPPPSTPPPSTLPMLEPVLRTERVVHDTDDPAIWIHPRNPSASLVLGTDKNIDGALYAFDLDGKVVGKVPNLRRPNNVDVESGLSLGGVPTHVAVVTERLANQIRVFRLPDLAPVDGGGIAVFEGEAARDPMGIALYRRPRDGAVFAIVGRKSGPTEGYLWQYRLEDDGQGRVKATKVRAFGAWKGEGEIEAIAVDDALGFVYYSDEWAGVRKYASDPDAADAGRELALFATEGFREDREGISIYSRPDGTGFILVSDQQANQFQFFPREGSGGNPHAHPRLRTVHTATLESDGSEVASAALPPRFPGGLFVAMSEGGTFHYYSWPDLFGAAVPEPPAASRVP
jgi:3-phytase